MPPVSGCTSRARSSLVSSVPAMSMTAGPSGMDSGGGKRFPFEHDACTGEALLVADRQVVTDNTFITHQRLEIRMKLETRFPEAVLHHADALERDRVAEARPHGLR